VEYVLGAVQAVYRRYREEEADYRSLPQRVLVGRLGAMGQSLFAPPNVKGWPGGPSWLNTSTLLERDNYAGALAMGTLWPSLSLKQAIGGVRAEVRAKLVAFLAEGNPAGPALSRRVREAVHAILSMAEYQLA